MDSGSFAYRCLRGKVYFEREARDRLWECRIVVKKGVYSGGIGRFWKGRICNGGGGTFWEGDIDSGSVAYSCRK